MQDWLIVVWKASIHALPHQSDHRSPPLGSCRCLFLAPLHAPVGPIFAPLSAAVIGILVVATQRSRGGDCAAIVVAAQRWQRSDGSAAMVAQQWQGGVAAMAMAAQQRQWRRSDGDGGTAMAMAVQRRLRKRSNGNGDGGAVMGVAVAAAAQQWRRSK
jgi:hypothetical protein